MNALVIEHIVDNCCEPFVDAVVIYLIIFGGFLLVKEEIGYILLYDIVSNRFEVVEEVVCLFLRPEVLILGVYELGVRNAVGPFAGLSLVPVVICEIITGRVSAARRSSGQEQLNKCRKSIVGVDLFEDGVEFFTETAGTNRSHKAGEVAVAGDEGEYP